MARKIILAFSVLLLAVVATLFVASPAAAEPTVKWNPKKVEETLQPGQSRVIETSFTALADVPSAVLRVATSIAPYVTVQPSSVGPVSKGQTIPVTLTMNVPIDALPATTSGALQLRVAEPHGKKEFGKTIARPLPVDVCVEWPKAEGLPGGVSFSYPTFGAVGVLGSTSVDFGSAGTGTVYRVQFQTVSSPDLATQYLVTTMENNAYESIRDWFIGNVDPDGVLLSNGTVELISSENGMGALVLRGEIPAEYDGGPVSEVFAMSPSTRTVVAIVTSNSDTMGSDLGLGRETLQRSYLQMLTSMTVP